MSSGTALCWLRRDLRLSDHAALSAASEYDSFAAVFVFDSLILDALEDRSDPRVTFIHQSLTELDQGLRQRGSRLIGLHGDPVKLIPKLAAQLKVNAVIAGRDYEPYARSRDEAVKDHCEQFGIQFFTKKDHVVFEGGEVLSQVGQPFRVYTPYSKAWKARFLPHEDAAPQDINFRRLLPLQNLDRDCLGTQLSDFPLSDLGFSRSEPVLAGGETAASRALSAFLLQMDSYADRRDFPSKKGTSQLSVHFRFGTISIREAVRAALSSNSVGAQKWLNELIWREFYQDVLFHHPSTISQPFQPQYQELKYPGTLESFEKWKAGVTGYPIVDASMRCLAATGTMHNRLRMVVSSFLTKDLLCDWRWGERWFAQKLLDFELASNVGGWQWSASVGADAQPYFRIFNPILQSRKFDPEGEFIRQWLPELTNLDNDSIHWPTEAGPFLLAEAGVELGNNYPHPIVDHFKQKEIAIKLLESAAKA